MLDNVLMLLATSTKFSANEEDVVIPKIMSGKGLSQKHSQMEPEKFLINSIFSVFNHFNLGFRDCCFAAGTEVRGGQTTRNPWVLLGGCATSVLERNQFVMPTAAIPGDVLICTKPLGTQV